MVGTVNAETTTKTNFNENNYKVVSNNDTVFTDVPKGHWAYESANALRSNRIAQGDEAANFNGNMLVKREQYAQFFFNAIAKNRSYNFNINSKEELKQMLTTALQNGTFGPFKLDALGKDIYEVKKEFGAPDVWKQAPCTECDAPNTAVYGDYNIDMYPSDARYIWVKMDISINE